MFTVSRLVRINQVVRCKVIRETRFNDTFYYFFLYKREVGNWAVVREFIFVQGRFLEDMTNSLRVWWKLPELSDRLTMLVIVGTRSAKHSLRSQEGIGPESHCLLGVSNKIWDFRFRSRLKSGEVRGCFRRRRWMRRWWCRTTGQRETKFSFLKIKKCLDASRDKAQATSRQNNRWYIECCEAQ